MYHDLGFALKVGTANAHRPGFLPERVQASISVTV